MTIGVTDYKKGSLLWYKCIHIQNLIKNIFFKTLIRCVHQQHRWNHFYRKGMAVTGYTK